jgi:hypothetical protein
MSDDRKHVAQRGRDVFEGCLKNRRDVTRTFFGDYGGLPEDLRKAGSMDDACHPQVRDYMLRHGLFRLADAARGFEHQARELMDGGAVAAVDGTDAIRPIPFLSHELYAVAVGHVTSRSRHDPQITLTVTSARFREDTPALDVDDIQAICEQLDEARADVTWTQCFRAYCEREYALQRCPAAVLLDGPIFTAQLINRSSGRQLYDAMLADASRTWIGIVKDISRSSMLVRHCAEALDTGEAYCVAALDQLLLAQLEDRRSGKSDADKNWLLRSSLADYVRVVYRPGLKAFSFECRRDRLGLAVALLVLDASKTLHHELPMLLETIDAKLRGQFHADAIERAIRSRAMRLDLRKGIDLINERDLR